ncbi:MAG TPA: response regulator [Steroidobacter sp.]|uniref:response regulator n=1 Tax=Steroidobacter sp. TaxID=1978227 RepID=UPI002ED7C2CC
MPDLPHIVIVDSDLQVRGLLSSYLQSNGFRATAVADGKALDRLLDSECVDLIVLDPMLPGENGVSICKRLRAEARVPVIILTSRRSEPDRIYALEIAQDYVAKPFNPRELLARIKNVLGRWDFSANRIPHKPERYRFARWTLDTISRTLIDPSGNRRPLAGSEYRLLEVLASQANRVLSRDELMELTKGREATAFDRSIDVQISRLRRLLGEDARAPSIIKTIYGEGYVIGVRVETE